MSRTVSRALPIAVLRVWHRCSIKRSWCSLDGCGNIVISVRGVTTLTGGTVQCHGARVDWPITSFLCSISNALLNDLLDDLAVSSWGRVGRASCDRSKICGGAEH